MLDAGDPQALHARAVDRALPRGEFLEREVIALEHFVDRQQAAVDRRDDLGLAPHDPPFGAGRGQVGDRQRLAERADYLSGTDFLVLDHLFPRVFARSAFVTEAADAADGFAIG